MLPELSVSWQELESRRHEMLDLINNLTPEELLYKSEPDRWSILQVLQHVVVGDVGMRHTESEMRNHPLRDILQPGEMVQVVKDVLDNDVPVDVPHPSLNPDGQTTLDELRSTWQNERQAMANLLASVRADNQARVMFSHAAAGPLTAQQMLDIALAHTNNHFRQIERILTEIRG
jgi:uncharacterized damage-inducible protein DinB